MQGTRLLLCRRKMATAPAAPSSITARIAERTRYLGLEPRGYSEEEKDLVYRAYRERGSKRAISRIFGVSRNTLTRWLNKRQLERDEKPAQ